jgi:type III secretion protein Q
MMMLSQAAIPNLHSAARGLPQHAEATSAADAWPKILLANVATLNALYRHRRTIEALVAGHTVAIETAPRAAVDQDAFSFRLSFSGRPAFLRLSASLVDLCARSLAVAGFNRLGGVRAAMLLELALLRPIKALEGRLRMDIRVEERVDALDRWERLVPLHLVVRGLPAGDAAIELLLDHQIAAVVVGALDDLAVPNALSAQLLFPVRVCLDGLDLTLAELRGLRPGDIVLPDRDAGRPRAMVAVIGEHLSCQVERAAPGFRLVSALANARTDQAGEWFMQQPTDALQRPTLDDAALDELPVRVVLELGRLDLPLAEIRRLAPGYILPLPKPSESAVDIVANGRRIGHGSLVKIGDGMGVRVERLLSDD